MSFTHCVVLLFVSVVGTVQSQKELPSLDEVKCTITWMAHVRVLSIKKIPGNVFGLSVYKMQVIEPFKGVTKGEVIEKKTAPLSRGGYNLSVGREYILSGLDAFFGKRYQMLRDQELDFAKMTEEEKQAFRSIDLDCPTKPVESKLSDRDALLKIIDILEKVGAQAAELRKKL
ncbi:hypothetical protein AB6A40_006342 [Gnathostoma spinigerum]|uniref:Uncharacterized protein n=1 Tax=Gnathostoma spinigerum TaxID=75299 RepID=A0ABD6ERK5_9BILA